MKTRRFNVLAMLVVATMVLAACGPQATPVPPTATTAPAAAATPTEAAAAATPTEAAAAATPTEAMADETPTAGGTTGTLRDPEEAALEAAGGQQLGGTVSVLGVWGGSELESFMAMIEPFQTATGVQIEFEGTRDLNAVLSTRVQGGNPPDVAGLPGPGQMAEFAEQGALVDMTDVLDLDTMREQYAESWIDLASVDGKPVGIFIKASLKGLIWYNTKQYQGPKPPANWDELMTWSRETADAGTTPWCIGLESAEASGWPGTDWIEDFVLRQSGPEKYDEWYQGTLAWSSPEIKQAWEAFGAIATDPKMVYGGPTTALTLAFGNGGDALFSDPPGCYLHHQASFISDNFVTNFPELKPGEDFDFFGFPDINPEFAGAVEAGGDLFGMFNDTPQARALMKYLVTPEAQAIWVERGGAISPNKDVPLDTYPDDTSRNIAEILTGAQIVRFDASDLMPQQMNNEFWKGILDYVQNPGNLDSILSNLDRVQQESYQR